MKRSFRSLTMSAYNRVVRHAMFSLFFCFALCPGVARAGDEDLPTTLPSVYVNHLGLLKLGWQLAVTQATFEGQSPYVTCLTLHKMGVHHLELSAARVDPQDFVLQSLLVNLLMEDHLDAVSYAGANFGSGEREARDVFDVAQQLKIKTILVNAGNDDLDTLDALANQYQVRLAVDAANPDAALALLSGRSPRAGFIGDLDEWRAAGIPAVDAVKKLRGHLLEIRPGEAEDAEAVAVLRQLKADGFRGIIAVGVAARPQSDKLVRLARRINALSKIVGDLSGVQ
jgi:hypothetical protein